MERILIYIYCIYFPTSNKYYIGQTNSLFDRMIWGHLRDGNNSLIGNALQKYDDWIISILHTCKSRDEANRIEIEEIRNFNCVAPNGYNISHGGGGFSGVKRPDFAKITIERNKKNKGKKRPEISGDKNPAFEIMRSDKNPMKDPEIAKKNADARKGKKSPWTTERNIKDNPMKNPEVVEKVRQAQIGKKCPYLSESNKENNPMNRLGVKIKRLKNRIAKLEKEV